MSFLILFLFVMGAVWGSFLNVVILRSSKGKSFLGGRSMCPKCKHVISWNHNIPIISFILLRGKCAYCHKKISLMYPVVEMLTGLFFVWWFLVGSGFFKLVGSPWQVLQPIFWLIVGLVFIVIFVVDLLYMVIPYSLNLFLFSITLTYKVILLSFDQMQIGDFWNSVMCSIGLTLFLIGCNWVTRKVRGIDGFGLGDIYLAPSLGLILGWPKILPGMFLTFISGSVVGIALIILKRKRLGNYLPFAPFLLFGTVLSLMYGSWLWEWYMSIMK